MLPYGVNMHIKYYDLQGDGELASRDVKLTSGNIGYCFDNGHWVDFKPYLRPMLSMTEEEKKEIRQRFCYEWEESIVELMYYSIEIGDADCLIDWFLEHHFDYRGLIEKGLALEAPEDMYKTE